MFAEEQALLKTRLTESQRETSRLERENFGLHTDLKALERRFVAIEKDWDRLARSHEKLQRRHSEATTQADEATARVDELEIERVELDRVREQLTTSTAALASSTAARLGIETGLVIAEKKTSTLRFQVARLEEERDIALVNAKRLEAEAASARAALKETQARLDVQAGEFAELSRTVAVQRKTIDALMFPTLSTN